MKNSIGGGARPPGAASADRAETSAASGERKKGAGALTSKRLTSSMRPLRANAILAPKVGAGLIAQQIAAHLKTAESSSRGGASAKSDPSGDAGLKGEGGKAASSPSTPRAGQGKGASGMTSGAASSRREGAGDPRGGGSAPERNQGAMKPGSSEARSQIKGEAGRPDSAGSNAASSDRAPLGAGAGRGIGGAETTEARNMEDLEAYLIPGLLDEDGGEAEQSGKGRGNERPEKRDPRREPEESEADEEEDAEEGENDEEEEDARAS